MKKYINGNGFLTEEGKDLTTPLKNELIKLINAMEPESEGELRTLGAVLSHLVGNAVSNHIQQKKERRARFDNMSDRDFYDFLKDKYGERWQFVSLTPEEYARVPRLPKEKIEESLKRGREAVKVRNSPNRFIRNRKIYFD